MVILLSVVAGLVLVYFALTAVVAWFMVHPFRVPIFTAPGMMGERQESFKVKTEDGVAIKGWYVPAEGPSLIVFCHGYMMNRCEFVPFASLLAARGVSSVFFDFRAHGWSEGSTSRFGVDEHMDVAAVARWAREREPSARVVLFGGSMGAASAARALAQAPDLAEALVLDCPYARLDEATDGWWAYLDRGRWNRWLVPVSWFGRLLAGINPKAVQTPPYLAKLQDKPMLFLMGGTDPLVGPESRRALAEAAGPKAKMVVFEQSGHSEGRFHEPERYLREVFDFLRSQGFVGETHQDWIKSGP